MVSNYKKTPFPVFPAALGLFLIVGFFALLLSAPRLKKISSAPRAIVNHKVIFLEIADHKEEWAKGLSFRKHLAKNKGMLFVFHDHKIRTFWNKGMEFPLDVVWISSNKVVGVNSLPSYKEKAETIQSPFPVDKVLEVNLGKAKELGIKKGSNIIFQGI